MNTFKCKVEDLIIESPVRPLSDITIGFNNWVCTIEPKEWLPSSEFEKKQKSSKYPYIAECSTHGAIAVFESKGNGTLLVQGSSWVKPGAKVCENGFQYKKAFNVNSNATVADREMAFLKMSGFDISRGFWEEDVIPYKNKFPFAYDYIINYKRGCK